MTGHDESKENWTIIGSDGKTYTRREICVLLDRTFRCGRSTSGSPLEYYGPIPRRLSKEESREFIRKSREKYEKEGKFRDQQEQ